MGHNLRELVGKNHQGDIDKITTTIVHLTSNLLVDEAEKGKMKENGIVKITTANVTSIVTAEILLP